MMWKTKKDVPAGIRYLSQWSEFKLENYPDHCIIHKQIPGCGFTEYALNSNIPVVLCSPRKMLMENKKEQHGDKVYLVISEFDRGENIDSDVSKPESRGSIEAKDKEELKWWKVKEEVEQSTYTRLFKEIGEYISSLPSGLFPKIIVTYDSSYLVKRILEQMGIIDSFYFVIDEFQSVLEDARFKAGTELDFLITLQDIKHVVYVSATPMLDKYIKQIPQFQFLPYYKLDWGALDPTRIKKPNLKVRTVLSIISKMKEIIKSYLEGNFEKVIVDRGGRLEEVISNECVIYVNSVNHILNIIKKFNDDPDLPNITPEMVNILCSNTPENRKKIKNKLGKDYKIGKVPLKGEHHKLITLCTRTVYLGADFYSTCARSFIFSDANSDCLSVDISMDLAQILGRQRLEENPWSNSAEFYYKTTADYKKMTEEQLNLKISLKEKETEDAISLWEKGTYSEKIVYSKKLLFVVKSSKYKDDYVAVNRLEDGTLIPVSNILVKINDQRSFDIQQVDYCNRFSVFSSLEREFSYDIGPEANLTSQFFYIYDNLETYLEKIKYICEYLIEYPEMSDSVINNLSDHDKIKQQLIALGPERIKGLGYHITKISKAMGITIFDRSTLNEVICEEFIPGQRYTKKYIKEKLGEIYKAADFKETPKANQLEVWFEIKECKMTVDGKREMGFEIISIKSQP